MTVIRRTVVIVALVIAAVAAARPAEADIRLTGFGGFSFLDEGTKGTAGAALTFGGLVGFEFEAARTWLGDLDGLLVSDAEAHMTTYMGNIVVRLPAGPIQPYASAGIGTVRVSGSADGPVAGGLEESDSSFGWNIGGGLYIVPLPIFAIRADVRRIEAGDLTWDDIFHLPLPDLSFWRFTAGLTLKF
jgi:opacity protein-like surface antigen